MPIMRARFKRKYFSLQKSFSIGFPNDYHSNYSPENVPRLYDLVQIEDERLAAAFYFALHDTLVANDMDQATRISFGKKRYRVVTLKGDVIEVAGTMSGGGKTQFRGKMGERVKTKTASHNTSIGGNTVEDLDEIRERAQAVQNEINYLQQMQGDSNKRLAELRKMLPVKEAALKRSKTDIDTFAHQIPALEAQLEEQRKVMEQTQSDAKKVAELNAQIAEKKKIFTKCQADAKKYTDQIETIAKEIKSITADLVDVVEKSIDSLTKQMTKLSKQVLKLNVDITTSERNVKKTEENIETMKNDIETAKTDLTKMDADRNQAGKDIEEIEQRLKEIIKEIAETQSGSSEVKKEIIALQKQESDGKLQRVEMEQQIQKIQKQIRELKATIPFYQKQLEPLKLHNIPNEDPPQPLKTYTDEEMAASNPGETEYLLGVLEEQIKAKTPNLNVIDEYQKKRDIYMDRIKVLEEITTKRNEMRKLLDEIKKRRYQEFTYGFTIITRKLKEMYQMITQGGNAELELGKLQLFVMEKIGISLTTRF